jgi:hypothetical protein
VGRLRHVACRPQPRGGSRGGLRAARAELARRAECRRPPVTELYFPDRFSAGDSPNRAVSRLRNTSPNWPARPGYGRESRSWPSGSNGIGTYATTGHRVRVAAGVVLRRVRGGRAEVAGTDGPDLNKLEALSRWGSSSRSSRGLGGVSHRQESESARTVIRECRARSKGALSRPPLEPDETSPILGGTDVLPLGRRLRAVCRAARHFVDSRKATADDWSVALSRGW